MKRIGIHPKGDLSIRPILDFIKANEKFNEVGAVACFFGFVKKFVRAGEEVKGLELEAYEEKAEEIFSEISEEMRKRPGIIDVTIHHVIGKLEIGDLIFVVMIAGKSRKDVFPALVKKQRVGVFKVYNDKFIDMGIPEDYKKCIDKYKDLI